jgi:hypothetical protein
MLGGRQWLSRMLWRAAPGPAALRQQRPGRPARRPRRPRAPSNQGPLFHSRCRPAPALSLPHSPGPSRLHAQHEQHSLGTNLISSGWHGNTGWFQQSRPAGGCWRVSNAGKEGRRNAGAAERPALISVTPSCGLHDDPPRQSPTRSANPACARLGPYSLTQAVDGRAMRYPILLIAPPRHVIEPPVAQRPRERSQGSAGLTRWRWPISRSHAVRISGSCRSRFSECRERRRSWAP